MPNVEIITKWVEALESGEYEQGFRALASPLKDEYGDPTDKVGYCCLGVLCDLYRKETGRGSWDGEAFGGVTSYLPLEVAEWAGLGRRPSVHDEDGQIEALDILNDGGDEDEGDRTVGPHAFGEIAALIRKEYLS